MRTRALTQTGILGITLSALLLTACDPSKPALTEPLGYSGVATASRQSKADPSAPARPFTGSCDLRVEVLELNFPILRQRDTGTCHLSHLGRALLDGELLVNLVAGIQIGRRTFTAANGDLMYADVVGTSTPIGPGLIGFTGTFTFTGGTGRFANASGTAVGTGIANQITRNTTVSIEGVLSY